MSTPVLAQGLTSKILEPVSGKATHLIVYLHGFTGSATKSFAIGEAIQSYFPNAVIALPNAPEQLPVKAFGPDSFRWGAVLHPENKQDPATRTNPDKFLNLPTVAYDVQWGGVKKSGVMVNDWLDSLMKKYNISPENTAIIGFSQGGVMALHTGLSRQKPVGGVVSFGAILFDPVKTEPVASKPNILVIHGAEDKIVSVAAADDAQQRLQAVNIPVQKVILPGIVHVVDAVGFDKAMRFLKIQFK